MSDEGQRVEFHKKGPYIFQKLDVEPQATLLEDYRVCLFQFNQLFLPVSLGVCHAMADSLSNLSQSPMGPEQDVMTPLEFDLDETTELPLVTAVVEESYQHNDVVFIDVFFDETAARLCFSVRTAAAVAQILSQVPEE